MRSMLAGWPLVCLAGAREGEQWGRPTLLQVVFQHGKIQPAHTFCSRPIPRWPCLIHSDRAVAVPVVAAVEAGAAAVPAGGGPGGGGAGKGDAPGGDPPAGGTSARAHGTDPAP